MQVVWRILALVAVLLMPLGMFAPAAAAHQAFAAMPMEHCPDQSPHKDMKSSFAECTMACSAALPAMDGSAAQVRIIACVPIDCPAAKTLTGVVPEIATPPPKRS